MAAHAGWLRHERSDSARTWSRPQCALTNCPQGLVVQDGYIKARWRHLTHLTRHRHSWWPWHSLKLLGLGWQRMARMARMEGVERCRCWMLNKCWIIFGWFSYIFILILTILMSSKLCFWRDRWQTPCMSYISISDVDRFLGRCMTNVWRMYDECMTNVWRIM